MAREDYADLLRTARHDEREDSDDEQAWDDQLGLTAADDAWKERDL